MTTGSGAPSGATTSGAGGGLPTVTVHAPMRTWSPSRRPGPALLPVEIARAYRKHAEVAAGRTLPQPVEVGVIAPDPFGTGGLAGRCPAQLCGQRPVQDQRDAGAGQPGWR